MKSSDGGASWSVQDSTFPAESISCFTIDECTAVGGLGIVQTTDGRTWSPQTAPTQTENLDGVSCPNAVVCFAVGIVNHKPSIIGTDGTTWTVLSQPLLTSLSNLSCFDGLHCTAAGISGSGATTLKTSDGGGTWAFPTTIPAGEQLNDVYCAASTTCIAVGSNLNSTRYVIGSANSGSTWSPQTAPSNAVDLTGISCSTALACIAVGSSGNNGAGSSIMGTTTGGLSWTSQSPPAGTSTINSVSCPSTADCFAAGLDSVLNSRNAGYAWNAQPIPSEVSGLNGISCASTSVCTAVGFGIFGSPVLIGTTDGGTNWTTETVPPGTGPSPRFPASPRMTVRP